MSPEEKIQNLLKELEVTKKLHQDLNCQLKKTEHSLKNLDEIVKAAKLNFINLMQLQ